MNELNQLISITRNEFSESLTPNRANRPTWVMWEVMNELSDDDLEDWGLNLYDVVEAVYKHIEEVIY